MNKVIELVPIQNYSFRLDIEYSYNDFDLLQSNLTKSVSDTQLIVIGGLDNAFDSIKNLKSGEIFNFDFYKIVYNNRLVKYGFRIIKTINGYYITDMCEFTLNNAKYYLINGDITRDLPQELLTDLENKKKFNRLELIIYNEFNEMSDNDDATPYTSLVQLKKLISNDFDILDIKFGSEPKFFTIEYFIKVKGVENMETHSVTFEYAKTPEEIYILNYSYKGEMFK